MTPEMTDTDIRPPPDDSRGPAGDYVSSAHFDTTMGQVLAQLEQLRQYQMQPEQMSQAVAAGLRAAAEDPQVWDAAGRAMRAQAQNAAGGWLLGSLMTIVRRLWLVAVVLGLVYALGGWPGVVALIKAQGARA